MYYWNLLWEWDSIDSVRSVHSALEGGALIFFAMLVLFDVLAHLSEDKSKERAKILERIGLCCFGVAVLAEVIAYPYSRRNDELSGNEIHRLSTVSEQARAIAADAVENVRNARREVDALGKSIEPLSKQATALTAKLTTALRQVAVAESHAMEATRLAQDEIKKRRDLERQLAWRTLDPGQRQRIASRLMKFAGQQFDMSTYDTEPECVNFENELYRVALVGHWMLDPKRQWHGFGRIFVGIQVYISEKATPATRAAADGLVAALTSESVPSSIIVAERGADWPRPEVVVMQVGKSPNSMQPMTPAEK